MGENGKTPFTRREWLLLIALLLIGEGWLLNASFQFSDGQAVLNYISFAGTVASTLLAVVAIIYSFVQSEANQRTSTEVGLRLEQLRKVAAKVATASAGLRNEMDRIDAVATKLDSVHIAVTGSQSKLDQFEPILKALSRKDASLQAQGERENEIPVKEVAIAIFTNSAFEEKFIGCGLAGFVERGVKTIEGFDFIDIMVEALSGKEGKFPGLTDPSRMEIFNFLISLKAIGGVSVDSKENEKGFTLALTEEVAEAAIEAKRMTLDLAKEEGWMEGVAVEIDEAINKYIEEGQREKRNS